MYEATYVEIKMNEAKSVEKNGRGHICEMFVMDWVCVIFKIAEIC